MNKATEELFIELYKEKYGPHINSELAESIVEEFAVTDGSGRMNGEKWNMAEAREAGIKAGVDFEKINKCEWYIVLNMMYSDYFRTAKKRGIAEPSFFVDLAIDWFNDADGKPEKTFEYFL